MREVNLRLWIGNAADARNLQGIHAAGIEAIVDLAMEELPVSVTRELLYCRIPLVDGSDNSSNRIILAVGSVLQLIDNKVPTLVACSAGMSRSPAIVAAAFALSRELDLETSLTIITDSGPCDIHPALLSDISTLFWEPSL